MEIKKSNFLIQIKYSDLLRDIENIDNYLLGFGGELYLSHPEISDYDENIIGAIRSFIVKNNLLLTLHAPIVTVDYSKIKDTISRMSSLYKKVITLCKFLNVNSVVAHAEFAYGIDSSLSDGIRAAVLLWRVLSEECAANNIELNIENHCETGPESLMEIAEEIDSPNVGICLDVGHCNVFGKKGIWGWLEKIPAGYIKEVHLADNEGDADTHLPLGEGNIDFARFFAAFEKRNEKCIFVLEPNNAAEAKKSLIFLRKKGYIDPPDA